VKKSAGAQATRELLEWSVPRLIGAGYGLFSKKAANPRWPEFFITAFVLKKYREKNSFWFMITNAMKGMKDHQTPQGESKVILAKLIGSKPRDLFQLSGIYRALAREKGPAVATAAIIEIVRITNEKRKNKKRKHESNTHQASKRRRRPQDRRVARAKASRK